MRAIQNFSKIIKKAIFRKWSLSLSFQSLFFDWVNLLLTYCYTAKCFRHWIVLNAWDKHLKIVNAFSRWAQTNWSIWITFQWFVGLIGKSFSNKIKSDYVQISFILQNYEFQQLKIQMLLFWKPILKNFKFIKIRKRGFSNIL